MSISHSPYLAGGPIDGNYPTMYNPQPGAQHHFVQQPSPHMSHHHYHLPPTMMNFNPLPDSFTQQMDLQHTNAYFSASLFSDDMNLRNNQMINNNTMPTSLLHHSLLPSSLFTTTSTTPTMLAASPVMSSTTPIISSTTPTSMSSTTSTPSLSSGKSNKRSDRDEPLDEGIIMHIREAFLPFNHPSPQIRSSKKHLAQLIGEYLRDEMTLKSFFKELSTLTSPISSVPGDIYRWLIHLLIFSDKDPHCKLLAYMLENGVDENDIELGGIKKATQQQGNQATTTDPTMTTTTTSSCSSDDISDRKSKDKPRVRKSVSKGLRNPPNKWTKEESQRLIQLVNDYGDKSWKKIAEHVGGGKTGAQCAQHWKRVLCPIIRKGSWDDVEEMQLFHLVEKFGQSWKNIASEIGSRTDIQCRYQYFKSCMSREVPWSDHEDDLLLKKLQEEVKQEDMALLWVEVARYMSRARLTKIPRTALECRMRWEIITTAGGGGSNANQPLPATTHPLPFHSSAPSSSSGVGIVPHTTVVSLEEWNNMTEEDMMIDTCVVPDLSDVDTAS